MLKQFLHGKVYVFIDAANILYSQQTLKWRVDYKRLTDYIKNENGNAKFYYYTGKVGSSEKQEAFLKKLARLGYNVVAKEVKIIRLPGNNSLPKGNLDVELALDAYRLLDNYDTLLLCSGDSDFAYLLDLVKQKGKKVIVLSTRGHVSKELLDRAKYIDLRKLRNYLEFKQ